MATVVPPKGHYHTRAPASSHNPKNSHQHSSHAHAINSGSEMNYSTQPTTPPRTPRKEAQNISHTKSNSTAHETGSKQKPRNKRPKNVMTSPAVLRNDNNSPPLTAAQSAGIPSSAKPISTPSTAAYAGPTFHASPAPSALPIPSFYSKSVPESPGFKGDRSLKDSSLSESPSRVPAPISNLQLQREESPLDFFFKADREEKARARSASSAHAAATVNGPFQPPVESPRTSQTPPVAAGQNRPRNRNRISSSGMFAMELDGEGAPGTPYGPAFSTPYSERINSARTAGFHEPSPHGAQQTMTSEALKAYLFSGHQSLSPEASSTSSNLDRAASLTPMTASHRNMSSHGSGQQTIRASSRSQNNQVFTQDAAVLNNTPRTSGRSSGLRQEVTPTGTPTKTPDRSANYANPSTPSRMYKSSVPSNTNDFVGMSTPHAPSPVPGSSCGVSPSNGHADIKGMEDSLRRILKLDSNPGSSEASNGGMPAATASVPSYVGGRNPPMNGMYNGVMGS